MNSQIDDAEYVTVLGILDDLAEMPNHQESWLAPNIVQERVIGAIIFGGFLLFLFCCLK